MGKGTHPMEELLSQGYGVRIPRRGDVLEGTVMAIEPSGILIDVGMKSEGLVPARELQEMEPEAIEGIEVGDQVLAYVVTLEGREGDLILSLKQAQMERDWRAVEKLFVEGAVFNGKVVGYNKGGLLINLGKVQGFVPASQIARQEHEGLQAQSEEDFRAKLVGVEIPLKIIELDRGRNRLILSERAALRYQRREERERLLAELQEGDIRHGVVDSLCDFGAFVDIGGIDGLIHISELSWGHVSHPGEVLQMGDEVDVYVLSVDRAQGRIGLSLKRLQPEPWGQVEDKYSIGQLVKGIITNLTKFGAFARLEGDEIEGLIHISELSDELITHPKEAVQVGDALIVKIIGIDAERHRISLSLRQVSEAERVTFEGGLGDAISPLRELG
ncbi:MAG: S1 RNA-binding domain-containing protein [Chloroflexota bacterium]|nr:S1 RNA-binding domain-containing protein [Chloroflexota bacterium]